MEHDWEPGQKIREARQKNGISQIDAAHAAGVGQSWWVTIERGGETRRGVFTPKNIPIDMLAIAAYVVGLDPYYLVELAVRDKGGMTDEIEDTVRRAVINLRLQSTPSEKLHLVEAFLDGLEAF